MTQISLRFKEAVKAEVKRLMEQSNVPLIKEIVATERAGAFEMSRRLKQLGFPTKVSGNNVLLTSRPIERHKIMAIIERIQKGGMDVSFMLKTTPGVQRYDRNLRKINSRAKRQEAVGSEPMTPDERRDAYSGLRVTLNGKPAEIQGFRNRFASVWARGVGSADFSWDAIERVVRKGGKFKAEIF